jgi:hypothetical protein
LYIQNFQQLNAGGTHTDIMEVLQMAHDNNDSITDDPNQKQELIDTLENRQIEISDIEGYA